MTPRRPCLACDAEPEHALGLCVRCYHLDHRARNKDRINFNRRLGRATAYGPEVVELMLRYQHGARITSPLVRPGSTVTGYPYLLPSGGVKVRLDDGSWLRALPGVAPTIESHPDGQLGSIYLLHLDPPYRHASHYLGWALDPEARIAEHLAGHGTPLIRAAVSAGCVVRLVRVWANVDRNHERSLKMRKSTPTLCPVCRPELRLPEGEAWAGGPIVALTRAVRGNLPSTAQDPFGDHND